MIAREIAEQQVAANRRAIMAGVGDELTPAIAANTAATHDLTARMYAMQTRPKPTHADGMLAVFKAWVRMGQRRASDRTRRGSASSSED